MTLNSLQIFAVEEAIKHLTIGINSLRSNESNQRGGLQRLAIGVTLVPYHITDYQPTISVERIKENGELLQKGEKINISIEEIEKEIEQLRELINS